MLKSISKFLIAGVAMVAIQPAFSMGIYTVKSNDYLYKIAKSHSVSGTSVSEMTDAIKGINKSEIPGIVDNRIKVGDKLAIPTTKDEVEDGLTITRNQMINGSYGDSGSSSKSSSNEPSRSKLGDNSMVSSNSDENSDTSRAPSVLSQDQVPTLVPGDENSQPQTYSSNINTQISSDSVEENQSDYGDEESGSFFGSLLKLIVYIVILAAIVLVGKRIWESQSSKREQEQELISKKKRDHLMSRISPVVSDNDFYRPRDTNMGPQEEFDFFGNTTASTEPQRPGLDDQDMITDYENEQQQYSEDSDENDLFENREQSIVVKTEKGVVFETSTDESLINNNSQEDENSVEEIDAQLQAEQELQYIDELIEQFLDSEKYVEASITLQDSLEKNPNNIDLRYKLLEVYAKAGEQIAFEGEVHFIKSKNIVSMFDPLHQKIAKLRDKYFD